MRIFAHEREYLCAIEIFTLSAFKDNLTIALRVGQRRIFNVFGGDRLSG